MPKNKYIKVVCLRTYMDGKDYFLKVGEQYDCLIENSVLTVYINNKSRGCFQTSWFITLAELREQRINKIFED
jgi:hypothetical protein